MVEFSPIGQKVWNYCHTLRDEGVGYGYYLEQLTYLLFLKMAHEYAQPPYNRDTKIPEGYDWESLRDKEGEELEAHYNKILMELGKGNGMIGQIFFKAQNKIQDPAKLKGFIKDESLGDMENLPEPDVLANDIIENLEAGLDSFKEVQGKLGGEDAN